jgi:hypothetical protein
VIRFRGLDGSIPTHGLQRFPQRIIKQHPVQRNCEPFLSTTMGLPKALFDGTDTSRTISVSPELGAAMRIDHKKGIWTGCS